MEFSIRDIAHLLKGEIDGDEDLLIDKPGTLDNAGKGSLSFLSNPKYSNQLYTTSATAVLVSRDFKPDKEVKTTLIRVEDPYLGFSLFLDEYARLTSYQKEGIEDPSHIGNNSTCGEKIYRGAFSYIGDDVKIGNNVKIFPHVYIGDNVLIGDNTILHPGVKIYNGVIIASHCQIHAGAVVGSDGFGYVPHKDGSYKKIPQVGNVILEDHVEIGANTTIDRATLESTIIKKGVKLDNLVQVAHNVSIGENTAMAAQAGIAGSTVIGKNCIIAGQAAIIGHISIPDRTTIGAQSGVTRPPAGEGEILLGSPAFDLVGCRKSYAIFKKLPELRERLIALEKKYEKSG